MMIIIAAVTLTNVQIEMKQFSPTILWDRCDVRLHFSKSVLMKKIKLIDFISWMPWGWVHFQQTLIFGWTILLTKLVSIPHVHLGLMCVLSCQRKVHSRQSDREEDRLYCKALFLVFMLCSQQWSTQTAQLGGWDHLQQGAYFLDTRL